MPFGPPMREIAFLTSDACPGHTPRSVMQPAAVRCGQSVGWAKSIKRDSVATDDRFEIDFFTSRQRGLHAAKTGGWR